MNYLNSPYIGSELHKSTAYATPEQLKAKRQYTVGAIEYHKKLGNVAQAEFFAADLALIDKRLA